MTTTNSTTTIGTTDSAAMAKIRARARELARTTTGSGRAKAPRACECGCGGMTRGGTWLPGHDAKVLSRLLAEERRTRLAAPPAPETPTADAA